MKKLFGFGSGTPAPPPPPLRPPSPPAAKHSGKAAGAAPASIVGRWKEPASRDSTVFHADGTVTEELASGEMIRGRYLLVGTKLTIHLEGVPEALNFSAAIRDDTLEMTDPERQTTKYRRA